MPKEIQEKGILPIKIFDVILDLHRLVDFPIENLDMSEFVINKNLPTHELSQEEHESVDGPLLYDLFAISNHFGNTGGGHYTAFCK